MRISDWSSDVCSSDLPIEVIAEVPDGLPAPAELVRRAVGYLGDHLDRLRRIEEVEGARRRLARLGRLPGQRRRRVDRGQHGRAAWRASGGQSVSVWVGAAFLKKQKQDKTPNLY